jgi:hypothetical protein
MSAAAAHYAYSPTPVANKNDGRESYCDWGARVTASIEASQLAFRYFLQAEQKECLQPAKIKGLRDGHTSGEFLLR